MKNILYLVIIFFVLGISSKSYSQNILDSLSGFDEKHAWEHTKHLPNYEEQKVMYEQIKRNWIKRKYHLFPQDNSHANNTQQKLVGNQQSTLQGPQPSGCGNVDFEAGNTSGWTTAGYAQITSGAGTDPYGGFPVVFPGGNYSLKLSGDWATSTNTCDCTASTMGNFCNSAAQKVIPVSVANAQMAFHFAMIVYNYPHSPTDAAYIQIQILNSSGNPLPCPLFKAYFSNSSSGGNGFTGISGVTPSVTPYQVSGCTGTYDVTYIPWQTVNVDLSAYIGQSVTLDVQVHWCQYQVDWAYAYIDADCYNTSSTMPPVCLGSNVCAPPGFAGYNWLFPGGGTSTSQCITPATPGTYTVVCQPQITCSASQTITVNVGGGFTTNIAGTNVSCNGGSNGSATVTTSGGTPPFTYTWSPSGGNGAVASGLTAGLYSVTVQDANCAKTLTVNITQPPGMTLAVNSTSSGCTAPGTATVSITGGGTGPFTYSWMPIGGTNSVATGLASGNYTATVQDANGCAKSITVNVPGSPSPTITSISATSVSCNGGSNGSATVTVSSGITPYTYTWSPSGGNSSTASSLSFGTYTVTVKDAGGCIVTKTVTVAQPPALSLTINSNSVLCNGGANGSATATPNGGVGGYSYTWSPSGGNASVASGLGANTYTVNIKDINGCIINGNVTISQPPALSLTISSTSVSCNNGNNGTATANPSGGVGGYSYVWSNGQFVQTATNLSATNYTVTVKDNNNCTISNTVNIIQPSALTLAVNSSSATCYGYANGSATATPSGGMGNYTYTWLPTGGYSSVAPGLVGGTYSVQVADANNCLIIGNVVVTQPTSVSISTSNYTICNGGTVNISVNAAGGTSPYTYSWTPTGWTGAGPYNVSLTSTAFYTVYAMDANNCSSPVKVVKAIVQPPLLATGMSTAVCDNGQTIVYPTITSPGNGGPYSYSWSNGATSQSVTVTGNYATQPNTYTVTISDGCTVPNAVAICTVNVHPLPKASFTGNVLNGCVPLLVNFNAASSGGTTDTYVWNFGNSQNGVGNPASVNYTLAGTYSPTLTVTSQFGCTKDTVAVNYIQVYPFPTADFIANPWGATIVEPNINFTNASSGAVSYIWNFGDVGSPTNTSTAVNPSHEYTYSGTYTVSLVVTNQYGCADYVAKTVYIDPEFHLYIPNVFTPDGNGLNDVFQPKGVGIDESDYKMLIFDRWGEQIFSTNTFSKGWDGTVKGKPNKATQDVYVYKIYVKDLKGTRHEFVGHVTCLPGSN